jgi:21S rRNA (GM2251-2'-O)-methyltransferase
VQLAPSRRSRDDHEDEDDGIPISVPFTTAASEFLYGYNSVLAALKGQRRKLYKLYIHPKIFDDEVGAEGTQSGDRPASELADLADYANVPIRNQVKNFMLDKMSGGRPHNGVVLEASKLPSLPVLSLQKPEARKGIIPITLAEQSAEEAKVNGTPRTIPALSGSWRYPLVVLLDGITDPGNLGNIIRTCHFYGVDAVAIATNTCANLSSGVLAKASAGACEAMSILSLPQPSNFVRESAQYRWKVYAAVAPISNMGSNARFTTTASIAADSPLAQHPCILMLGAEGAGLRENLKSRADKWVAISGGARADHVPDVGVDSMNVGSAAGVLLESFLRKPASAPDRVESEDLGF